MQNNNINSYKTHIHKENHICEQIMGLTTRYVYQNFVIIIIIINPTVQFRVFANRRESAWIQ